MTKAKILTEQQNPVPSAPAGPARPDVQELINRLRVLYPRPECALRHENPFQLLVATILSAQCTDERVNSVTPALFRRFPGPAEMAAASPEELETLIHSTGFFRNKAKNLKACAAMLASRHECQVPRSMEELLTLPGVARKTANVVLGSAYGIAAGIVVDTHVLRVAFRLGLSDARQPERMEQDLMALVPRPFWIDFSHWLILHGRQICQARKPACQDCPLAGICSRRLQS